MKPSDYDYCIIEEDGEHAVMFRNRAERQERADHLTSCGIPKTLDTVGWPDFNLQEVEDYLSDRDVFVENLAENQYQLSGIDYQGAKDILDHFGFKRVEQDW